MLRRPPGVRPYATIAATAPPTIMIHSHQKVTRPRDAPSANLVMTGSSMSKLANNDSNSGSTKTRKRISTAALAAKMTNGYARADLTCWRSRACFSR